LSTEIYVEKAQTPANARLMQLQSIPLEPLASGWRVLCH
jgi:hypothetical protein